MSRPLLSIVTPVFNQARYIRQTIESVLDQKDDRIEYIVMDGGSTDGTAEIIREYEGRIDHWQSGPDGGQSNAIADGFSRAKGRYLAWINGDDFYLPGVLGKVLEITGSNPGVKLIYGDYVVIGQDGLIEAKPKVSFDFDICLYSYLMIPQPSSFWSRELYFDAGGINTKFQFAFDWDLFLRMGRDCAADEILHVHDLWSAFRLHDESKSVSAKARFREERGAIQGQFAEFKGGPWEPLLRRWHLLRVLRRFKEERGFIPVRKDSRKA
ncbi:glycosyltransferase family 2 protein [Luteolibacter marinus]|uniref:glycosyltransferase family 2 protein n=1 Tax=Luteolibacter marinus TaxID=2776705 RepID=UPI001867DFF0|nr:glycosyltransferase family 2 protein [Luteolibacter marinus]